MESPFTQACQLLLPKDVRQRKEISKLPLQLVILVCPRGPKSSTLRVNLHHALGMEVGRSMALLRPPAPLAHGGEAAVLQAGLLSRRESLHEVDVLLVGESLRPSPRSAPFGEAHVPAHVARRHPGGVVVLQHYLDEDALGVPTAGFLQTKHKRSCAVVDNIWCGFHSCSDMHQH